uniref:CRAL-TRIO domain-containing protein n=1 Tax=Glossina brevipalpis TaxID=37001 RepID=A0A1A9WEC8_9MUSC
MLELRPLNEDLQKKAKEELNEIPERIGEELNAFKTWIEKQPHLRANTDDQFLIAFLRGCKYNLEKAKKKIDAYYTLKTKFPDLFGLTDIDNEKFREIFRLGLITYLPIPLYDNGPRILFVRNVAPQSEQYHVIDFWIVHQVLQDILILEDDYAAINGVVMIADWRKTSANQIFQITPTLLKRWNAYTFQAMPIRLKCLHVAYAPKIFEKVFNFLKSMWPAKLQQRLFVHNNSLDSLIERVPLKYLPREYGGENGSIKEIVDEWDQKFNKYRDYFKKSSQWGTNEKARIENINDYDNMFGLVGSFKTLQLDW